MPYLGSHRRPPAAGKRRALLIAAGLVVASAAPLPAQPASVAPPGRAASAAPSPGSAGPPGSPNLWRPGLPGFGLPGQSGAGLPGPGLPGPGLPGLGVPGPAVPGAAPGPVLPGGAPAVPGATAAPAVPGPGPKPGGCALNDRLVPSCGALWGVAPGAHTDDRGAVALAQFERTTGRPQAIFHAYHDNTDLFPTAAEAAIARDPAHPRLLLINWKPPAGVSWARIAAGDRGMDSYLDRLAAHIRRTFPERFFLAVHHEPENQVRDKAGSGWTARDYRAMYRHVVQRLRGNGARNAVTVMIYMSYVRWNAAPWFQDLYPGDDVVDWVAWDAYAYSKPGTYGYGDFAELMNRRAAGAPQWPGFYTWASRRFPGKPLMIAEWGVWRSAENAGHQAAFFSSVARQIGRYPRIKAMVYFNTPRNQQGYDSRVDGTPAGLRAYRSLGADQRFRAGLARG